ncbi:hypothetical protein ACF0H5_010802 [Mactra antiquata]
MLAITYCIYKWHKEQVLSKISVLSFNIIVGILYIIKMGSPRLGHVPSPLSRQGPQTNLQNTENMYRIKTVLVGDINVGKTSLANRFAQDRFDNTYKHTIGASFINKTAIVSGYVINFQIWDTAGQERYRSLVPMYLRGAHIAFIVYDVTEMDSYGSVGFWLDALQHHGDMIKTVLVANKCDLEHSVDQSIAEIFAEDQNLMFFSTSAKTGYNVDKLFHTMGSMVVEQFKNHSNDTLPREPCPIDLRDIDDVEKKDPYCKTSRKKRPSKCCKS